MIDHYRRFLFLVHLSPAGEVEEAPIVPTDAIDVVWHYHILDTEKYCEDSDAVFAAYLHHFQYFGFRGKGDEEARYAAIRATEALFIRVFGEVAE